MAQLEQRADKAEGQLALLTEELESLRQHERELADDEPPEDWTSSSGSSSPNGDSEAGSAAAQMAGDTTSSLGSSLE